MTELLDLDAAVKKQRLEEEAVKAIDKAIIRGFLLGKSPSRAFFTVLVTKHQYQPDWSFPTMATDGKTVRYNPEFVCSLSHEELIGVLAHEALHPAYQHHARRGITHERP